MECHTRELLFFFFITPLNSFEVLKNRTEMRNAFVKELDSNGSLL